VLRKWFASELQKTLKNKGRIKNKIKIPAADVST
jgi:hypothetical protein